MSSPDSFLYMIKNLRQTLLCLICVSCFSGALCAAAEPAWRAQLDAIELLSEQDDVEAKRQLDALRTQFTSAHMDDALAAADAIDCWLLLNTAPNKAANFAKTALAGLATKPRSATTVELTLCRGSSREQTGDLAGARQDYQAAADSAKQVGALYQQADALGYLADLDSYQGDLGSALGLARGALSLLDHQTAARDLKWQRVRRSLVSRMANIYVRMEEPKKAIAYYEEALDEDQRLGNLQTTITDYYNLGRTYEEAGDLESGVKMQRKSLALAQSLKSSTGIAWAQRSIGAMLVPAIVARADTALYQAKQSGRNRVEIAD